MKKIALLFTLFTFTFFFTQIRFEKGYFIKNDNSRVEALIKNIDWKSNPTSFDYKLSSGDNLKQLSINDVQLFEIYNESKYISATVKIDRSSTVIDQMSDFRAPKYKDEKLFLKEIVEGHTSLYEFTGENITRFFIKKDNENPIQLIYKPYLYDDSSIAYNDDFKKQLQQELNCTKINEKEISKVKYNKNDLQKIFLLNNNCDNTEALIVAQKREKGNVNINIRPRLTISKAEVERPSPVYPTAYENKNDFGLGVEFEYIFPFHKNKWSIFVEPTYRNYESEVLKDSPITTNEQYASSINYQSIQIPIGLRHYFFITQKSKIFMNAMAVIDITLESQMDQRLVGGEVYNTFEISTKPHAAVGTGYVFNNKYGAEIRYFFKSNIASGYPDIYRINYSAVSFILSYNVF